MLFRSTVKVLFNFLRPYILLAWNKKRMELIKNETEKLWLRSLDFYKSYNLNKNIDFPIGLAKDIDELDAQLNLAKQLVGFGLRITKEEKSKTVMRRYLKASKEVKKDDRFSKGIPIS